MSGLAAAFATGALAYWLRDAGPVLAIVPVFVLDGVALVFGVGFTGFGGCAALLAYNRYRYGNDL